MLCFDVQMDLEAYVDGELSPERTVLLEQHLAGCEGCQVELARLQEVLVALESWPLVTEPAQLTAHVMAQVRQHSVVSPSVTLSTGAGEPQMMPSFRIRWSDFAISAAGAGLVFVAALIWRYLTPTGLTYLRRTQMYLRLEMLRLELLTTQCLTRTSTVTWGLMLVGVALMMALTLAVWDLAMWRREALSV